MVIVRNIFSRQGLETSLRERFVQPCFTSPLEKSKSKFFVETVALGSQLFLLIVNK